MWENFVDPGRSQMAYGAYALHAGYLRLHTHTQTHTHTHTNDL